MSASEFGIRLALVGRFVTLLPRKYKKRGRRFYPPHPPPVHSDENAEALVGLPCVSDVEVGEIFVASSGRKVRGGRSGHVSRHLDGPAERCFTRFSFTSLLCLKVVWVPTGVGLNLYSSAWVGLV